MGSGDEAAAWHWLVEAQRALGNGGLKTPRPEINGAGSGMLDLYLPLLQHAARRPLVVGHLGQSIDGYIATESGGFPLHYRRARPGSQAPVAGAVRRDAGRRGDGAAR